jgi:murein L,D-transpeptidase YcbB/YkuD
VDWGARPFPYQIRQRPGPANALGALRFDLPNAFSVFLHDTPSRRLFARDQRALSHGCLRVQEPLALASAVLGVSQDVLQSAIDSGEQQTMALASPVPVYVLYFTTAAAADGSVQYLDDIYERDGEILRALDASSTQLAAGGTRSEPCSP